MVTVNLAVADNICTPPPVKKHRPRKRKIASKPVVTCPTCSEKVETVERIVIQKEVAPSYNNRIRLLGGIGPFNTDLLKQQSKAIFSMSYGPVFGLGYTRYLSPRWSLELDVLSNFSGVVGVGYGF